MPASRIACFLPVTPAPRTLDALADVAAGFSAQVERAAYAVYLEVGDLGRLFANEDALLAALKVAIAEVDIVAYIAIANSKEVARVQVQALALRRSAPTGIIVRPGTEPAALGPLPLAALGPAPDLLVQLDLWGIRTVHELARLPRAAVSTRLGIAGAALHRLACGEKSEILRPTAPTAELSEEQALLDPIDNLEPLLFVLRGMLERLMARLRARSQACGDLTLRFALLPRGEETRRIAVAAPMQKVAPLLELLRVALTTTPPTANVERLTLCTTPRSPRPTQLDLFAPAGPAPDRLATTLARLEALCGSGRVGQPVVPSSHAPGAAELIAFAGSAAQPDPDAAAPQPLLAARMVRPPRRINVARREQALIWVNLFAKEGGQAPRQQMVRAAGGPYRLRDVRGVRDYYDVELADGELLRLFHDLHADSWFLDAFYD